MPTYALLLYGDESAWADATEEDYAANLQAHRKFSASAVELGGKVVAGEALQGSGTAKTVRISETDAVVTDGPYASLKEQLGGFYLVEAESMEQAVEIAKRNPEPIVEVREIMVFE